MKHVTTSVEAMSQHCDPIEQGEDTSDNLLAHIGYSKECILLSRCRPELQSLFLPG